MEFGILTGKVFPFINDCVIDPGFVMQYVIFFLVLHNRLDWGRECWLFYYNCLPNVLRLFMFCGSFSRCSGFVYSV